MLVDFRVKNFALIDKLAIEFSEGLNILTGETGAGKSIIIGALEILLGARASTDLIRKGKDNAYIEAAFEPHKIDLINEYLEKVGIATDSNLVLLSRELRLNGKNRNRINGQLATATMIKEISQYLVDIHGQHEHQRLLDNRSQLLFLDEFSGKEEASLLEEVKKIYKKIVEVEQKLANFEINDTEKAREIDLLEFQIEEIEQAQLKDNEITELEKEFKILTNVEEIYAVVGDIYNSFNGSDYNNIKGILNHLASFMKSLEELKDFDPELAEFHKIISDIYYQSEDLSLRLNNYHERLEFDEEKLDRVENRLQLLTSLQRKYGQTVAEIKEYHAKLEQRLEQLKSQDKLIGQLNKEKEELLEKYYGKANILSKLRQKKAKELETIIAKELADLAMKNTVFKINFTKKKPASDGIDQIEFLIAPNLGEDLKPLAKIASGGELSRIMLALKTIIAHIDQVDTLIFDEVDTGVGGKVAQMMAEKLALISQKRQVICITHLPQIASMGDKHFFITKELDSKRTFTRIYQLEEEKRKEELARMLGGIDLTATSFQHAEEMLILAKKKKAELK